MTQRLYYHDPTLTTFDAQILERRETERGPAVRLDRTAFYPTSGGQPHDTGTLDGIPVRDVWEDEEGRIWHQVARLPQDDEGQGQIDWGRRFDHMQQHTGQHLLSAVFVGRLGGQTVGFHLGSEESTIDLDLPDLRPEDVAAVEDAVNALVWQDLPVTVQFFEPKELADVPLRKPPPVEGTVRVIGVAGVDASACGGTHVRRTGEIGLLKIGGVDHYKGGVRVTFLCGGRALRDYRRALDLLQTTALALTVGQDEVPDAVARLQDEVRTANRELGRVRDDLLDLEAERLWAAAAAEAGARRILAHWPDRSFDEARALAARLRGRPGTLALLATGGGDQGVRVVCARSDDLDIDAVAVLRGALAPLDGRGGGSPIMAQGGGPPRPIEAVMAALRQAV
jgi:alanyl-tRNA synthetase